MPEMLLKDERANRGLLIAADPEENIRHVATYHWHVRSQSPHEPGKEPRPLCGADEPGWYCVKQVNGEGWACQCPDAAKSHICKHDWACEIASHLRSAVAKDAPRPEVPATPQVLDTTPRCPDCLSEAPVVVRAGIRKTLDGRKRQRYLCRKCDQRFVTDDGEKWLHFSPDLVVEVWGMYMSMNGSCRKISTFLATSRNPPIFLSKDTVHRWVRDLGRLLDHYAASLPFKVGSVFHGDERTINVRSGQRNDKDRWRWLWHHMDRETRLLLASYISDGKGARNARASIRLARKNAGGVRPRFWVTDGNADYRGPMRKEFRGHNQTNPHVVGLPIRKEEVVIGPGGKVVRRLVDGIHPGNNMIERLQGTQLERLKTMRGVQNMESGQDMANAMKANYNLFRPHMGIGGQTPAEAAGVPAPILFGKSRGRALIVAAHRLEAEEKRVARLSATPRPAPTPVEEPSPAERQVSSERA